MSKLVLTDAQKNIIANSHADLEDAFLDGVEDSHGVELVPKYNGYDTVALDSRVLVRNAFRSVMAVLAKEFDVAGVSSTITVKNSGSTLSTAVSTLNFTGAGVTASGSGSNIIVNIPGTALSILDEGATISSTVNSINFTGSGVTATGSGTNVTVDISGGGGSSLSLAAVGAAPNANAATLSGSVLNLQPASDTFPGVITTGTQNLAGNKTLKGILITMPFGGSDTRSVELSTPGSSDGGIIFRDSPTDLTNRIDVERLVNALTFKFGTGASTTDRLTIANNGTLTQTMAGGTVVQTDSGSIFTSSAANATVRHLVSSGTHNRVFEAYDGNGSNCAVMTMGIQGDGNAWQSVTTGAFLWSGKTGAGTAHPLYMGTIMDGLDRIDATKASITFAPNSQFVGIATGTTTPGAALHVGYDVNGSSGIAVSNPNAGGGTASRIDFGPPSALFVGSNSRYGSLVYNHSVDVFQLFAGADASLFLNAGVADGPTAVGATVDTVNAFTNASAKIFRLRTGGSEKAYFNKDGYLYTGFIVGFSNNNATIDVGTGGSRTKIAYSNSFAQVDAGRTYLRGGTADSAGVVANSIDTFNALTHTDAQLLGIYNGGVLKAWINPDGKLTISGDQELEAVSPTLNVGQYLGGGTATIRLLGENLMNLSGGGVNSVFNMGSADGSLMFGVNIAGAGANNRIKVVATNGNVEIDSTTLVVDATAHSVSFGGGPNIYKGTSGITAFAGGGQASATALTAEVNFVTTVASTADSVKLPAAVLGKHVVIFNDGANSMNIFPVTGGQIDSLGANNAYSLAAGSSREFWGKSGTDWRSR
jgi:hypothetical protein